MKNIFRIKALFTLALVFGLALAIPVHAQVGPVTASTTINLTVNESVSISVDKTSVSAAYSSGNVVFSPITVNSAWTTNGTEHSFEVYGSFASANALTNGSSVIGSSKVSASVTGTACMGGLWGLGSCPSMGGTFGAISDSATVNVSNAIWIFIATIDGKVQPNQATWPPNPSGSATNVVTLTVNPTPNSGSLQAGTYSGVLNFTAQAL